MNKDLQMSTPNKILIYLVIIVHMMFFLLEAVFWMRPEVNHILIGFLDNPVSSDYALQALTLKNLFVNQGLYNFFLVCGGLAGLALVKRRNLIAGYALLLFLCFAGSGAGIVLLLSTKAYILAALQGLPAMLAFSRIYPVYKMASKAQS